MPKGKLPTLRILEDQNEKVYWFGDENTSDVNFDVSEIKDGDEMFWVRNGVREKMGFWVKHGNQRPIYYKESVRHLVIKPRWWWSQVKPKPEDKPICVGGKKRKQEVNPVPDIERETATMLEIGFGIVAREIIDGDFPGSKERLLQTAGAFRVLLNVPIPFDSPVRISILAYLGYLEGGEGILDHVLGEVNTFLLDSLKKGNQLIKEQTVNFLSEHDSYFAYPRNNEVDAKALLAAVREVVESMPDNELAHEYMEIFGFRD